MKRCDWAKSDLMIAYHDQEWGVPLHDDRALFEFLILEGMQAGLSWETILKKRDNFRKAYSNFNLRAIAKYDARKIRSLMADAGIIRNNLKIRAAILNARAVIAAQQEFGSFDACIWKLAGGKPQRNHRKKKAEVPSRTAASDAMSKELTRRGLKFVGSTICYAFMQAVGMVNDHTVTCFRWKEIDALRHPR